MFCGKIAAGKSTLAAQVAERDGHVLIAEDPWLRDMYPGEITSLPDYARCSTRLQKAMGPHVAALLGAGLSVVLDFPANTVEQRGWMRRVLQGTAASHRMHLLAPPDDVCLARLRARNAQGDHPFTVTEAQFHAVSAHFTVPSAEEGFTATQIDTA